MAVIAALLSLLVVALGAALVLVGVYYVHVLRPRLVTRDTERKVEPDPIAAVVDELNALARLRDQRVLTAREFTTKKSELLQRI
jgi:hypothetical protein